MIPEEEVRVNVQNNSVCRAQHTKMLTAALEYAALGWHVFPCHAPIFNDDGACVGCTCEAWKRTQVHFGSEYKCPNPGKCPAVRWSEKATTDIAQLTKWFGHKWKTTNVETGATIYFTPNIAVDCGASGLLALDDDAYKKVYGELGDLLSPDEQNTVTQLSGSHKGSHLIYAMPAGKRYGNAVGSLPDGIDVRGVGGYICVAPSLHKSGKRYEWPEGYAPTEIALQVVPAALQAILDTAHAAHATVKAVTFTTPTTPTTDAPELSQWHISKVVRELIHTTPQAGQRSETDAKVVTSLCYAGASDDDILAVFEHFPIGTAGKFAERGPGYLALTIGKARAYVETHPRPDVATTVANLRLFIKTHDPADHVPAGPGRRCLRKVIDGVCDLFEADGRLSVNVGKKRLAKLAGVDAKSVCNALVLLNGILFDVTPAEHGALIELVDNCRFQQLHPSLSIIPSVFKRGEVTENDKSEYSVHKADDVFASGVSRFVKMQIRDAALATDQTYKDALQSLTAPGFGEGVLLARDTGVRLGDMTAQEYADETGIKLSSARAHLRKCEQTGLAESYREGSRGSKIYTFATDFWSKIEEVAPTLRTYRLTDQREDDRLVCAIQWTEREKKKAQLREERERLHDRIQRLSKQRIPHLSRLLVGMTAAEVTKVAYDVIAPFGLHPAKQAKLERLHGAVRMDLAEARRAEQWELSKQAQQMRTAGDGKRDAVRQLTYAGYTLNESWTAVQQVWRAVGGA